MTGEPEARLLLTRRFLQAAPMSRLRVRFGESDF